MELQKILDFIEKEQLISEKERIIAGISGGADSVCLFFVLLAYQKMKDFTFEVVHVNHGIRGAEADRDQQFVEDLCGRFQIPCHVFSYDVPKLAKEWHLSEEEAGRKVRYEALRSVKKKQMASKIAVAHHKNDQAETILMNLIRGTGITGLQGMKPETDDIIRPLLCVERSEIEAFLQKNEEVFCIDYTNDCVDYTRNALRLQVIPALQEKNQQAVSHICKTGEQMQKLGQYLEGQLQQAFENLVTIDAAKQSYSVEVEGLQSLDEFLRGMLLHRVLCQVAGVAKDIASVHVDAVASLLGKQTGRLISLPYGMVAKKTYESIVVQKIARIDTSDTTDSKDDTKDSELPELEYTLLDYETLEKSGISPQNEKKTYTKYFDYDKIKNSLKIRTRKDGDYFCIDDAGHQKKLQDFFVNEKIPHEERDRIYLLADGSHIVWIIGYRISSYYKVTDATKTVIKVQMNGGNEDE